MAYIGRGINSGDAVSDHLTGSGATVYTLTYDTTTDGVVLSLDGVVQRNGTDFTILGTQLTFTSAVASPIAIQIIYTGLTLAIGTPGTGTVGVSQLSSTGTASSSTYLRGDNSWATIADEITKSSSDPTVSTNPAGGVGTVYLNTTSGEMWCLTDATAGANVWTNIGDGTDITYMSGTGGTITTDGNFKVHTFNTSGTFTPTVGTVAAVGDQADYLIVAGGAGGAGSGASAGGGGGGAGGFLTGTTTLSNQAFTVTVGGGGGGGAGDVSDGTRGTNGGNSSFTGLTTAVGGGGGGTYSSFPGGKNGGSGGGAGTTGSGSSGSVGLGTAGQGNNGGTGWGPSPFAGGGGGGSSAVGVNATSSSTGANGGNGTASSITGSAITYAGGGYGGGGTTGPDGANGSGGGGTVNRGGGGGGGTGSTDETGVTGGSGVVIIRYQFQA